MSRLSRALLKRSSRFEAACSFFFSPLTPCAPTHVERGSRQIANMSLSPPRPADGYFDALPRKYGFSASLFFRRSFAIRYRYTLLRDASERSDTMTKCSKAKIKNECAIRQTPRNRSPAAALCAAR